MSLPPKWDEEVSYNRTQKDTEWGQTEEKFELHEWSIHCNYQEDNHHIAHFLPSGRHHECNVHGSNGQRPVHK